MPLKASDPTSTAWLARLCVGWAAFLLFSVQLLAGQNLLPLFGGGPGIWTACLLFFQAWVLAGYAAAQGLARLNGQWQLGVWLALLIAALVMLPAVPRAGVIEGPPTLRVIITLVLGVGVPSLVLAMTSPLAQSWMGRFTEVPYGLFAWSNAGSLLALALFPFVLEPLAPRSVLVRAWGWGLGAFTVLAIVLALRTRGRKAEFEEDAKFRWRVGWVLWSAVAVSTLMIVSRNLSQEIAPGPFTWVAPLAVYLLTFVLSFGRPKWYSRVVASVLLPVGWTAVFWLALPGGEWPLALHLAAQLFVLFIIGWTCHAELHRLRPVMAGLTSFYTSLAGGGVLGGLAVAVIAPLVFERFWENLLVHVAAGGLFGWTCFSDEARRLARRWTMALLALALVWTGLGFLHLQRHKPLLGQVIARERNFFGVLTVVEHQADGCRERLMLHGATVHGLESDDGPALCYYGSQSGVGVALAALRARGPLRIGGVGLGTGTLAAYGRAGDTIRFYEINPAVITMARDHFSYLKECPAKISMVTGDARLKLAMEESQQFDLLEMDAFQGGIVPVHLLTREAFHVYVRHLEPDGVLALHLSSHQLNLAGVARAAAREMGWFACAIEHKTKVMGERDSLWVLLTASPRVARTLEMELVTETNLPLWRDDHASLFRVWR